MPDGSKIVFVGGVWDLFHVGHLKMLQRARAYGDTLIVGVSTDELVFQYKKVHPVFSFDDRTAIIDALSCVDRAVSQSKLADVPLLQLLNVGVFVTGDDWRNREDLPSGYEWIRDNIRMVFLPRTSGISSSGIIDSIRNTRQ